MAQIRNRQVVLVEPIDGVPALRHFRIDQTALRELNEGELLIRNIYCSVDPGTRSRLSPGSSYTTQLKPGDMITGFALGRVAQSRHADYRAGELVAYVSGWTEYQISRGRGYIQKVPPRRVPLSAWIGVLGIPGLTAWFGLHRVAALQVGARVLISSAAGPVGATAGQIAKHRGASHVVGVAGGDSKCAWLRDQAGFDGTVDYKQAGDLAAALARASADGYDILFDNVGNTMIDAAIPLLRQNARIVISGQTSAYNSDEQTVPGLRNTRHFIAKRLRMEGILVFDDLPQFANAQATLADWLEAGTLVMREEKFDGLEQLPHAFAGLFSGASFGRRVVQVGPES
jgi:NADPH-dependent curcumin reductase